MSKRRKSLGLKRLSTFNCCYCEQSLNWTNYSTEHLVPLWYGGGNGKENIRASCRRCNRWKGGLLLFDWIMMLRNEEDKLYPRVIRATLNTMIFNAEKFETMIRRKGINAFLK